MSFKSTFAFYVPPGDEDELVAQSSEFTSSCPPSGWHYLTLVGFIPYANAKAPNVGLACFVADGYESYPAEKLTAFVSPAHDADGNVIDGLGDKAQGRVNGMMSLAVMGGLGSLEDLKADGFSSEDMVGLRFIGKIVGFVAEDNAERTLYANIDGDLYSAEDEAAQAKVGVVEVESKVAPKRDGQGGGSGGSDSGGGRRSRRSRGSDASEGASKSEDTGRSDEGGSDDEGSSEDSGGGRRRRSRRSR